MNSLAESVCTGVTYITGNLTKLPSRFQCLFKNISNKYVFIWSLCIYYWTSITTAAIIYNLEQKYFFQGGAGYYWSCLELPGHSNNKKWIQQ